MSCGTLHSGERFLAGTLAQLDCQAQAIGSYGFAALADPASPASLALSGLLTLFVALFAVRLLVGRAGHAGDLLLDLLRVGIVLTLATSWPAWRVLGYDLLINGPGEVFRAIGLASGLPGSAGDLAERMQRVDEGLAALNVFGSGRLGVASGDWFELGFARAAFLTGAIVPTAVVRLASGLLLALAPLMAGLLLFGASRSLFAGWVKGLAMLFLASIAVSLIQAAELALIEPWLQDALARRAADQQVLDAPIEALVMTLSFALAALGLIAIAARIAFVAGQRIAPIAGMRKWIRERGAAGQPLGALPGLTQDPPSRAGQVAVAVNQTLLREGRRSSGAEATLAAPPGTAPGSTGMARAPQRGEELGSSYRRTARRHSASSQRRDTKQ